MFSLYTRISRRGTITSPPSTYSVREVNRYLTFIYSTSITGSSSSFCKLYVLAGQPHTCGYMNTKPLYHRSVQVFHRWSSATSPKSIPYESHYPPISLSRIPVEVFKGVGHNVSTSNIVYKSHYKSIGLRRVMLKYSGEIKTMFDHGAFPTNHITNQSLSLGF